MRNAPCSERIFVNDISKGQGKCPALKGAVDQGVTRLKVTGYGVVQWRYLWRGEINKGVLLDQA